MLVMLRALPTWSFHVFQTFEEIIALLRSVKTVKGIRLRIGAAFWGEAYAADSEKEKYTGTISRWHDPQQKTNLMVLWEGYSQCQRAPLNCLDKSPTGVDLELELLPYDDGTLPQEAPIMAAPAQHVHHLHQQEPADQLLEVNGQQWMKRCPTYVDVDARTEPRYKPSLNTGGARLDSIEALFYFLLPPSWIEDIMQYTNPMLDERDRLNAKLTEGELLRFFGYMLSLSVHKGVPLEKMWSKTPLADSSAPPPMMGRFGMSQNRFYKVRSIFTCGPTDDASLDKDDWCFVEPILEAFNKQQMKQVTPGWLLAPDESMGAWRGKVGKRDPKKIPKLMFVRRKPEPLGAEFKNIGDAQCGMILNMEITKGKAEDIKPKFWSKENGATAATTMRLSEPWFGSNRVVAGDSWFASVRTAEMLAEKGLHFIGDVKTGTKRFVSKSALDNGTEEDSGSWSTWTSELSISDRTVPIYCVSHRRGDSIHGFIATCGTTLLGDARKAYFEDEEERVNSEVADFEIDRRCPRVLNDFTLAQPTIDRHNRYRQHILGMEKRMATNNYSFRFFTTMLGMLVTNAFFAHRHWNNERAEFLAEVDRLAVKLMHNPKIDAPSPDRSRPAAGHTPLAGSSSPGLSSDGDTHYLTPLHSIDGYSGKKSSQQRCIICNKKTSWACASCTSDHKALVPLCPEVTTVRKGECRGQQVAHRCLGKHRVNPTYFPKGKSDRRQNKRFRGNSEEESDEECMECNEA